MQIKTPTKTWADVPDIITPLDYAEVIGVGENTGKLSNSECSTTRTRS